MMDLHLLLKKLISAVLILVLFVCTAGADETVSSDGGNPLNDIEGMTFSFSSGAGAWETVITFSADGSFVGSFHDSDLGDAEEGYPYGKCYFCNFTGNVIDAKQSLPFCRKLQLVSLSCMNSEQESFVEDGVLYVPSAPYGLENADVLWLYQPDTPLSMLPEGFLPWAQLWSLDENEASVLGKWGLYNDSEECGFVALTDKADEDTDLGRGFFDVIDDEPFFVYSENGQHYGYEMDYWGGCSVWCAVADCKVSAEASSYLAPQGNYSYEPANVLSGDRGNAWVEGAKGYGIGEYVNIIRRYEVSDADYGVDFRGLCVVNGYARTKETWAANSRVKELRCYFDGRYVDTFTLEDTIEPQYFDLTVYGLHAASGAECVFHFEIDSVYPGEKYADTAITGIELDFWTPNH